MTSDLVLLHGVGLDHRMWARCHDALSDRHRVLALDLLGHGAAAPAAEGTTLQDLAADVVARIPRAAHVVGFSLGALVAQQIALTHPQRVLSLGLVSSVACRSEQRREAVHARLHAARSDLDGAATAAVQRWFPPDWHTAEPDLVAEVLATLRGNDHASYLACYEVFGSADAALCPRLHQIQAPTLAVTGAEDTGSTPAMSELLANTIPRAHAEIIPNSRHLLPLQRPDSLTRALLAHTTEVDHDR